MDKITLERIEQIHPILTEELKAIYIDICKAISSPYAMFRFASVFRNDKEQNEIYAKGRTKPGPKVTNAKAGESYHNYGLAVDVVELLDKDKNGTFESVSYDQNLDADFDNIEDWKEVVNIFKRYGWEWGGDWKFSDKPHFQKTFGYSISQLKLMPKDKNGYPIFPIATNQVVAQPQKTCNCNCTCV